MLTAKYPGRCAETGVPVNVGDQIERFITYGGVLWKRIPHFSEPRAKQVSDVVQFSSGATFYRNKNGRCEDAPCCGCCTI